MNSRYVRLGVLWLLLLTVPWWLPLVGGYTQLGTRVLVYALAAMGLNLLLGFTGGLSFGHAAYYGLGAYGPLNNAFLCISLCPESIFLIRQTKQNNRRYPQIVGIRGMFDGIIDGKLVLAGH